MLIIKNSLIGCKHTLSTTYTYQPNKTNMKAVHVLSALGSRSSPTLDTQSPVYKEATRVGGLVYEATMGGRAGKNGMKWDRE